MPFLPNILSEVSPAAWGMQALSIVCLLQYVVHVLRLRRLRRENAARIGTLESALEESQLERRLNSIENQLLHDFLSPGELSQKLDRMLKLILSRPELGLAAFLSMQEWGVQVERSRGLSSQSRRDLSLEPELLARLAEEGCVVLAESELRRSTLFQRLGREDRAKVRRQMYLFAVGRGDSMSGVLITTTLFLDSPAEEPQTALLNRVLHGIAQHLEWKQSFDLHRDRLQVTEDMLSLRSFLEQSFDNPVQMVEQYLCKLVEMVHADRGAVFLIRRNRPEGTVRALARHGSPLQSGVQTRWYEHESSLAERGLRLSRPEMLDAGQLAGLGIDSLMGMAIVAPVVHHGRAIGILCLSRRNSNRWTSQEMQMVGSAADFLSTLLDRVATQAAMRRQATEDALTGLGNRRWFDAQFAAALQAARESRTSCSLVLVDLDRFKMVNDTYGHQVGDEVLRAAAAIIRNQLQRLRTGDRALAARYGGEELAIILPGMNVDGAVRIAESIRIALAQSEILAGAHRLFVTASLGVATAPLHGDTPDELIATADAALYEAKGSGRNRVCALESAAAAT